MNAPFKYYLWNERPSSEKEGRSSNVSRQKGGGR